MLAPLLWLSPEAAPEALKVVSNLLKGETPKDLDSVGKLLTSAEDAQCSGVLADKELRKELAGSLKGKFSGSFAAAFGDALGAALDKRVQAMRTKAKSIAQAVPKKGKDGGMPTFAETKAALAKEVQTGDAFRFDWMIWHSLGCNHLPDELPKIAEDVLRDRVSLAAAAGSGPVATFALNLHMLEHLKAYIAWEKSAKGSKVPSSKGVQVCNPFTDKEAGEVAARRVLSAAALPESVAAEVAGAGDATAVLKQRGTASRASAVLPLYVAPAAPKGGKAEKGGAKAEKTEGGAPAKTAASGGFAGVYTATATQELRWQLLAYQMRPSTTLGAAAAAPPPMANGVAPSGAAAAQHVEKPKGFAGIWASGAGMPPGHTPYSWNDAQAKGMNHGAFACTWQPMLDRDELPPGHTKYSWENMLGCGSAPVAATSSSAQAPVTKVPSGKAPAAKAAPAPAKKGAPAAAAAAEGSDETALAQLDFRCGRITECSKVPDAESLYLLKVEVGEDKPRQVVSSLVKHYKEEELKDRQVIVYCNIKPGKMRGYESQAMVLAATKDKGEDFEKCELLAPPKGTKEGTRPKVGDLEAGSLSEGKSSKNISKVWAQVQPLMKMNGKKEATFKGVTFTMPGGAVTATSLTEVGIY